MFNKLTENLNNAFSKLTGRGVLSEADINTAMREIRIALLEADVALPVAKKFIDNVKEKALGEAVVKSISPGQMVTKIVHDELTEILGQGEENELNLSATPPVVILMAGLQGSGKTTSSGKIANYLTKKKGKKVLLASLDIYRPAAQKQLEILANQIDGVNSLEIIEGQTPEQITKRALEQAKLEGFDVLILDTAGRTNIDTELMAELKAVKSLSNPTETLLATDAMTGQDGLNIATQFNEAVGITGIVLTRMDGDARGGVALSMREATGQPIKFCGVGEKIDEFEAFHPERIAGRILDMGDIVSLVEKAQEQVDVDENEKLMKKIKKGKFDLADFAKQIKTINKMGGMTSMLSFIPGLGKYKEQINNANLDNDILKKQLAIIDSMTKQERKYPKVLNASRKKRIAKGSATEVSDINKLLKQFKQMQKMIGKMKGMNPAKLMSQMGGMGNMPGMSGLDTNALSNMPNMQGIPNLGNMKNPFN